MRGGVPIKKLLYSIITSFLLSITPTTFSEPELPSVTPHDSALVPMAVSTSEQESEETVDLFPLMTESETPPALLTVEQLKSELKPYGTFIGGEGMSFADYTAAMTYEWTRVETGKAYEARTVDLTKEYSYEDLVSFLENLSTLEGVSLYEIGRSVQDRPLYMISIDRTTVDSPKTIVLTGSVHSRETAGSVFITKQLNDLLNDENAANYLTQVRIFAVPCVNPDGREGIAFDTKNWTYSDGLMWKANANGVDLNRNFPGLSWGQLKKGNSRIYFYSNTPTTLYFPGYTAGSEPETRALMKFLQYTVVDKQANILIDYHQQGRVQYAGKPWQTKEQQQRCIDLAHMLSAYLANDKFYQYLPEAESYGLRGEGSTLTDYACSLAVGAKFSPRYGFMVYTDGENEYPLIVGKKAGTEANPNFATATLEIGSGFSYLGYSKNTRKLLKSEYNKYNFDGLLYQLFDYVLE